MSQQIAAISLSAAVVGSTGKVDLSKVMAPSTTAESMNPQRAHGSTLFVYNESGCGLTCTFPNSGENFTLPAGAWRRLGIPPDEPSLNYTVKYVMPSQPVSILFADFYWPHEALDELAILGNSPIGVSALPTAVTQVIQDNQPTAQTLVESTPTGLSQTVLITTDGVETIAGIFTAAGMQWTGGASSTTKPALSFNSVANLVDIWTPQGGAAKSFTFLAWDGANPATMLALGPANPAAAGTWINGSGVLAQLAGQATAGSFGAAAIVAQALGVNVTVTTLQTILSYTPAVTGWYEISGQVFINNGTPIQAITAQVSYTDPDGALGNTPKFATSARGQQIVAGADAPLVLDGLTNVGNGSIPLLSQTIHASNSAAIVCSYQDAGGTPNDHVTFFIKRMA